MKFCIIGLGRLGRQIALTLSELHMEVLAVDRNESLVSSLRDDITQGICMHIRDEESLRSIGAEEVETAIVTVGENFAQSILITALLKKKLQIPRVITRAIDELHKDILTLIGADEVILPEREFGIEFADRLSSSFSQLTRVAPNFSVSQLKTPSRFVGKKFLELDLYKSYKVYCIGIKQEDGTAKTIAPEHVITQDDTLIFSGSTEDLEAIAKL